MRALALLLAIAFFPAAAGDGPDAAGGADDPAAGAALDAGGLDLASCGPPCGYIVPILDIRINEKPACGGGFLLAPGERPDDCEPLMGRGGSVQYAGTFMLYWDVSEDGHYLNDPTDPIEVTFSRTGGTPAFLDVAVEPAGFTLNTQDLFDPQYLVTEGDPPETTVWFRYEKPITVTWTRTGDPTPAEAAVVDDKLGIVKGFLRVKSDASGQTFKDSFGVEEFRFDAWASPDAEEFSGPTQDTPLPIVVLAAAVLVAALRRRG